MGVPCGGARVWASRSRRCDEEVSQQRTNGDGREGRGHYLAPPRCRWQTPDKGLGFDLHSADEFAKGGGCDFRSIYTMHYI